MSKQALSYRPEIDGLRAVAVLPVVFFHAGFSGFSGGYVGVDVFFVISGYLITTILLKDAENSGISVVRFYERRARRILPALFTVILASIPLAWLTMLPNQMEDFALSILAVLFFVSNFFFWRQDDYFGPAAEEMPLLHTWSLSVEEQFYLFFPPFLILAIWLMRRHLLAALLVTTLASFAICVWAQMNPRVSAAAAFYLLPSRAWEMGVGALCAIYLLRRTKMNRDVFAFAGLVMIALSVVFFDKGTPVPSPYTLLPVMGTACIILFCSKGGHTYRILTLKPMIWFGLISYSLYLWHQPLFAFLRISVYDYPSLFKFAGLIIVSIGLAYLSWRYIEQPFRDSAKVSNNYASLSLGAACIVFLLYASAEWQIGIKKNMVFADSKYSQIRWPEYDKNIRRCMSHASNMRALDQICEYGEGDRIVAVLGNSHAGGLASTLAQHLTSTNIAIREYSVSACGFEYGLPAEEIRKTHCNHWFNKVVVDILGKSEISTVVVAFRLDNARPAEMAAMLDFVNAAHGIGKNVIFLNQAPAHLKSVEYYAYRRMDDYGNAPGRTLADWKKLYSDATNMIRGMPDDVWVLDIDDIFCEEGVCYVIRGGVAMYRDADHISLYSANLITERIATKIIGGSSVGRGLIK